MLNKEKLWDASKTNNSANILFNLKEKIKKE